MRVAHSYTILFFLISYVFASPSHADNQNLCARALTKLSEMVDMHPTVEVPNDGRNPYLKVSQENNWVANFANSLSRRLSPLLKYNQLIEPVKHLRLRLRQYIEHFIENNKPVLDETLYNPTYWQIVAQSLQLDIYTHQDLSDGQALPEGLPPEGQPLLIPMNHALHGVEAIALAAVLAQKRRDCRIVMTDALQNVPGMSDHSFMAPVHGSARAQMTVLRDMYVHLKNGGCVILFPSGAVSSRVSATDGYAEDVEWQAGLYRIYKKVPQTTLWPVFVEGQPSRFFLWMRNRVSEGASGALHISELVARTREPVLLHFAKPYVPQELVNFDEATFLAEVRQRLYAERPPQ